MRNNDKQTEFGWTVDLAPRPSNPAEEARDEAVEKAGAAAAETGWLDQAIEAILHVSSLKEMFTADDVWQTGLEPPREARALGAAFTALRRAGVIEPTTLFQQTVRASRHAAPIRVWKRVSGY